jgi:hypothetical protein
MRALALFIRGGGYLAKQQKPLPANMETNRIFYAAPHPHAQETNIANIEDVEKIGCCTWKQALN